MPDGLLTEQRLRASLGGRAYRFYSQVGSTNDAAQQWAQAGAVPGSVVVADQQTKGRGRFGRVWSAPAGSGLLMSVILHPPLDMLPRVTVVGAVALCEALDDLLPGRISVKWPNDVLLDGLKTAGILAEASWQGEKLTAVVLGMGLNVSVDFAGSPLAGKATSLETAPDSPVDRAALLARILARVDHWSARIGGADLLAAWRDKLTTIGQQVEASGAMGRIQGIAVDVDDDGALRIRDAAGRINRVIAGEVTLSNNE